MTQEEQIDSRRLAEASYWRVQLTELGLETTTDFEAWLAASPDNRVAWHRVQAPWNFLGEHSSAPEALAARRDALDRARREGRRRWRPPSGWRGLAASIAAVAVIGLLGSIAYWNIGRPDIYRTSLGERRSVTLSDGSTVALDGRSEVRVSFSKEERRLALVSGQARFDVAHEVTRAFSVVAGTERVIATGTAFNVDLLGSQVLVTLIEGHVVVVDERRSSAATSPPPVELHSGERLAASAARPPVVERVSVDKATAWQNGQLVFENEPLSLAVARVSRYAAHPIVVADERAAELRFSGVFDAGDVKAFVDAVTRYLPVDVQADQERGIRLQYRE